MLQQVIDLFIALLTPQSFNTSVSAFDIRDPETLLELGFDLAQVVLLPVFVLKLLQDGAEGRLHIV